MKYMRKIDRYLCLFDNYADNLSHHVQPHLRQQMDDAFSTICTPLTGLRNRHDLNDALYSDVMEKKHGNRR